MSSTTTTKTGAHSKTEQTAFVEESVREGWSLADVQMWQTLCRRVAVLKPGTESIMYVLLAISEEQGISPLGLCHAARDQGHKVMDEKAIDTLCHIYGEEADDRAEAIFDEIRSDDEVTTHEDPPARRKRVFIDLTKDEDDNQCEEDSEKTVEFEPSQQYGEF